jgi:hypothetical protein
LYSQRPARRPAASVLSTLALAVRASPSRGVARRAPRLASERDARNAPVVVVDAPCRVASRASRARARARSNARAAATRTPRAR